MGDYADIDLGERNKLRHQIYHFRQHEDEPLTESWVKFQELLKNCYGHGLNRMEQVITFYERLNSDSKHYLDLAGGGDFYYMSPNEVYRMMEDLVEECKYVEVEEDDPGDEYLLNELYELIVKDNLEECVGDIEPEVLEFSLDELETVSPMDEDGEGAVLGVTDIDNVNSEILEEFLNFDDDTGERENVVKNRDTITINELEDEMEKGLKCLETVFPNKVIKDVMVNEVIEVREKPPDLDELYLRGIIDFIDKFVAWLMCRKDESLGKVGVVSFYKKKCKGRMKHVMFLIMLVILACTRKWKDAIVKFFEKLFVANQFCGFDDYFYLENFYHGKN